MIFCCIILEELLFLFFTSLLLFLVAGFLQGYRLHLIDKELPQYGFISRHNLVVLILLETQMLVVEVTRQPSWRFNCLLTLMKPFDVLMVENCLDCGSRHERFRTFGLLIWAVLLVSCLDCWSFHAWRDARTPPIVSPYRRTLFCVSNRLFGVIL